MEESQPLIDKDHPQQQGIVASFSRLAASILKHLQGHCALLSWEAKDAGKQAIRLGIVLLAALLSAFFAYFFLLLFLVFLLQGIFQISWIWICLGVGIMHLGILFWSIFYIRSHPRRSYFPATRSEIHKDIETLKRMGS